MAAPPTLDQLNAVFAEQRELQPEVLLRMSHAPQHRAPVEGETLLRRTPVWIATTEMPRVEGFTSRTHTVCVVGDPGRGTRSGLAYHSVRSDPKRGGVDVDEALVAAVRDHKKEDGSPACTPAECSALDALKGGSFLTREAFHKAYRDVRRREDMRVSDAQVFAEIRDLVMHVPKGKLEVWPQPANGPQAAAPNFSELDVRNLEHLDGKDRFTGKTFDEMTPEERLGGNTLFFDNASLRVLPGVDALHLLEAKRHILLQQLYTDEIAGRDGSLKPIEVVERHAGGIDPANIVDALAKVATRQLVPRSFGEVEPQQIRTALSKVATYQLYPAYGTTQGNCNTGTATLFRLAGATKEDIKSPSEFAYGLHHTLPTWQPLGNQQTGRPDLHPDIDAQPLRGRPVRTAGIEAALANGPTATLLASRAQAG